METQVTNLGFKTAGSEITVSSIQFSASGTEGEIPVEKGDLVFVTNGSMTADKSFGSMTEAPAMERGSEAVHGGCGRRLPPGVRNSATGSVRQPHRRVFLGVVHGDVERSNLLPVDATVQRK